MFRVKTEEGITGLYSPSPWNFEWRPSALISQTSWSSYLSHMVADSK